MLVNSYIVISRTRETLNDIIEYAGVDVSYGQLRSMISDASINSMEMFQMVITSDDPE